MTSNEALCLQRYSYIFFVSARPPSFCFDIKSSSSDRQLTSSNAHFPVLLTARDKAIPSLPSSGIIIQPILKITIFSSYFFRAHFAFIMHFYALAAPESYVALVPSLGLFLIYVQTSMFYIIESSIVSMITSAILSLLSVAALTKGNFPVVIVFITSFRGLTFCNHSSSDWGFILVLEPFLMSVTTLNGMVSLVPVTFQTYLQCLPTTSENLSN